MSLGNHETHVTRGLRKLIYIARYGLSILVGEVFSRFAILGITTTAANIQLGNFCTSTIKGVSNRKERVVRCFFRVF